MQKTVIGQIIANIDRIINRALNNSYNKNIKVPSFSCTDIIQPTLSGIHYSANNIDIHIDSMETILPVTKIEYRIPQTRFYLTYLQNEDFLIRIMYYSCLTIVIAEYYNGNSQQIIEIFSNNDPLIIQYPENHKINENHVKVPNDRFFIAQISAEKILELAALPDCIKHIIDKEINIHPMSRIETENLDFLSELDRCWAELKMINEDNEINVMQLIQNGISNLIWIQEIYLHFGWFDPLRKFYKAISQIDLSSQAVRIVSMGLYRFNCVCELIKSETILLKFKQDKTGQDRSGKFLNHLIFNMKENSENSHEVIQSEWNYLHMPAIKLKFQKLIQENPDEYIAFAYLALQHRLWWYEKLEDKIIDYLPADKKAVFRVISLISKFAIVRFTRDSIHLSKYLSTSQARLQVNLIDQITKEDTRKNKEQFTCIEKNASFYIKINKCVDFEFIPKSNRIDIKVQLYSPINKYGSICTITISDFSLCVPLIWDQFTIEFNKCRFKFLRKKNRFQVTIKFEKSIQKLKVNSDQIENSYGTVRKYYIPVKSVKSEANVSFYNEFGAKFSKHLFKKVLLMGYGFNAFGMIHNHFRIFQVKQKSSYAIDLDNSTNRPLCINRDTRELELRASKFDPVIIQIHHSDPLIVKLTNMDAAELFSLLKIFTENCEKNFHKIRAVCQANLGFIPQIEDIVKLIPDKNNIITIFSHSYNNDMLDKNTKYKFISINEKTKQTALWINPDYLNYLYSELFFRSLYE